MNNLSEDFKKILNLLINSTLHLFEKAKINITFYDF
jgi:hypothetical protein